MTRTLLALIIFFTLYSNTIGQILTVKYGPLQMERRTDSAMAKFRSNRFGQFIHWGYHKDWSISHVKSFFELIELLTHSVSHDETSYSILALKQMGRFAPKNYVLPVISDIG